ncbi:MAG: hypothetical protein DRI01_10800 [Chloroflexi bacterium]|nr:MAG: hypothetical protein DRI01_10800 [Chloroflexota bacterium]
MGREVQRIRLLLVEASEILRDGLAHLLQSESNLDIVSVSDTPSQAVKAARAHKPDVVLTDIECSKGSAIELILRIRKVVPDTRIIVFTNSRRIDDFFSAMSIQVAGYISKENSVESLIKMIALAAEGKLVIDPPMAAIATGGLKALDGHRREARLNGVSTLSKQEKAILNLMADGATNQEIANALVITENKVKIHVQNIMHKLHARHRLEATVCAIEERLQRSIDGSGPERM